MHTHNHMPVLMFRHNAHTHTQSIFSYVQAGLVPVLSPQIMWNNFTKSPLGSPSGGENIFSVIDDSATFDHSIPPQNILILWASMTPCNPSFLPTSLVTFYVPLALLLYVAIPQGFLTRPLFFSLSL